jgi:hypothetical protein
MFCWDALTGRPHYLPPLRRAKPRRRLANPRRVSRVFMRPRKNSTNMTILRAMCRPQRCAGIGRHLDSRTPFGGYLLEAGRENGGQSFVPGHGRVNTVIFI